jgi:Holliday junction resolvase RusA-like endonuclease
VRGRMIQDERTRVGKADHAAAAHAVLMADSSAAMGPRIDDGGRWAVHVAAYYPNAVQGDADRVLTLVLDALQGIAYATDRQVKRASVEVAIDRDDPRTEVRVWRIEQEGA